MSIHGPSLGIGAGIAVISILAAFVAMDMMVSSNQPLVLEQAQPNVVNQPSPTPGNQEAQQFSAAIFVSNASPILGDENAPITLIEFGDYQCHFCNKFFHETEHEILKNYVETGKVKIIFKDFTIIGPDSITAAQGSHCANEQGKFWEFHDILYNSYTGENNGWASSENVHGFAEELNLNTESFAKCMAEKRYQNQIAASSNDARTLGITGTPAFFIIEPNEQITRIPGAQPFEVFERIFDEILEK